MGGRIGPHGEIQTVIDYSLSKIMHRHDDGWARFERIEDEEGGHHGAAAHDPEQALASWPRRFRCACGAEIEVGDPDDAQMETR